MMRTYGGFLGWYGRHNSHNFGRRIRIRSCFCLGPICLFSSFPFFFFRFSHASCDLLLSGLFLYQIDHQCDVYAHKRVYHYCYTSF